VGERSKANPRVGSPDGHCKDRTTLKKRNSVAGNQDSEIESQTRKEET